MNKTNTLYYKKLGLSKHNPLRFYNTSFTKNNFNIFKIYKINDEINFQ